MQSSKPFHKGYMSKYSQMTNKDDILSFLQQGISHAHPSFGRNLVREWSGKAFDWIKAYSY